MARLGIGPADGCGAYPVSLSQMIRCPSPSDSSSAFRVAYHGLSEWSSTASISGDSSASLQVKPEQRVCATAPKYIGVVRRGCAS
jgi:hypothetical protein